MIVLCPGHHIADKGTHYRGFSEHDLAVEWVDDVAKKLTVPYTIVNGKLSEKVRRINALDCDLAIDFHFNGAHAPVYGCETLYSAKSEHSEYYAELMQDILARHFQPNRGIKIGYYKMDKARGLDYFLRETNCPALIIEPEFLMNIDRIEQAGPACCADIAAWLNLEFA